MTVRSSLLYADVCLLVVEQVPSGVKATAYNNWTFTTFAKNVGAYQHQVTYFEKVPGAFIRKDLHAFAHWRECSPNVFTRSLVLCMIAFGYALRLRYGPRVWAQSWSRENGLGIETHFCESRSRRFRSSVESWRSLS